MPRTPRAASAIRLLAPLLAGESVSQRADVSVVLSNHFVRYVVLPWNDVVSDEDWQALAQHQFRIVYGDVALEWVTTVAWQGPERPVLACASPKVLLDMVHATVRAAGMRLTSVSPYFVAAFNFCRRRLPDDAFWFGVVEPGRFSFGGVEQGTWVSMASRRLRGEETARLTETLEQEVLGGESAAGRGRAFVFSPEAGSSRRRQRAWAGAWSRCRCAIPRARSPMRGLPPRSPRWP